jgi:ABC-2 type transport system ATP-binding protein
VVAVDQLSFTVDHGTVVGFLGPNGAGKTTTLRALLGLAEPTAGTATIKGKAYPELAEPLRQVGAVLETSGFHPGRTARNHVRIQAVAGRADCSRVEEVLELVGLTEHAGRRVGGFSLGMRQRLGIATALVGDPQVLILDEPANGLDPEGVRWLRDLLRGLAGQGRTVLVSSHLLAEVAQTVDSVVIIDRGQLVTQSSLEHLAARSQQAVRVKTPRAPELAAALAGEATVAEVADGQIKITGVTPERIGALAAELQIPIVESVTETPNLEDVFLQLTGPAGELGESR